MKSINQILIFRVDASIAIGTGHLMRCLALAQAWQDGGGEAIFITACESVPLRQRLRDEGFQIIEIGKTYPDSEDWKTTKSVLDSYPSSWVVLDGYHFDPAYHQIIQEERHPLLVIDDMAHLDHYHADIVLNQNIHAEKLDYSYDPDTQLLLGPDYVLLRREFWSWRRWEREIPVVGRKVMITMGGSDPDNQTLKAIQALQQISIDNLEVVVIMGASYPYYDEIRLAIKQVPFDIQLIQNTSNMPELMAWADVAVSAGGSTCWELAFMALPSLMIILAKNQQETVKRLSDKGIFQNLGKSNNVRISEFNLSLSGLLNSYDVRLKMSERGRRLIDGYGVKRVLRAFDVI